MPGWLPPELKPRTQRPWKVWMCQPPPAGLGPSTSGLSEQICTVLKWRRKSLSSILRGGRRSGPQGRAPEDLSPRSQPRQSLDTAERPSAHHIVPRLRK